MPAEFTTMPPTFPATLPPSLAMTGMRVDAFGRIPMVEVSAAGQWRAYAFVGAFGNIVVVRRVGSLHCHFVDSGRVRPTDRSLLA